MTQLAVAVIADRTASRSERIIEIGPHLPKLSTTYNSLLFLTHPVVVHS